jgi:hypothetical protein
VSFAARTFSGTESSTSLGAYLRSYFYSNIETQPTPALVTWEAQNGGDVAVTADINDSYTWLIGGGINSDYDIRWTNILGTPSTGTTGTWLNLGVTRTWTVTATSTIKINQATIEIRQAALPNTVLATATVTLDAESIT